MTPHYAQLAETTNIKSYKTPWTGNGFTYFSGNKQNDIIIQHLGLPFQDEQTHQWLYRFNIASKLDGSLLLSKTRRKTEKKDYLLRNCALHTASFDANGQVTCLKGKTPSIFDPVHLNPHQQIKNLVNEARYILAHSQDMIMQSTSLFDQSTADTIPQAQHMLDLVSHTHHKNHLYIP